MEPKGMMDVALISSIDPVDVGLGSSEKVNAALSIKPRKKTMTSIYLKYFETAPDGKSRKCKFCGQSYSIATATGISYTYKCFLGLTCSIAIFSLHMFLLLKEFYNMQSNIKLKLLPTTVLYL